MKLLAIILAAAFVIDLMAPGRAEAILPRVGWEVQVACQGPGAGGSATLTTGGITKTAACGAGPTVRHRFFSIVDRTQSWTAVLTIANRRGETTTCTFNGQGLPPLLRCAAPGDKATVWMRTLQLPTP